MTGTQTTIEFGLAILAMKLQTIICMPFIVNIVHFKNARLFEISSKDSLKVLDLCHFPMEKIF